MSQSDRGPRHSPGINFLVILSIILLFSSSIYLRAQEETGQPAQLEPAEKIKSVLLPCLFYTIHLKPSWLLELEGC